MAIGKFSIFFYCFSLLIYGIFINSFTIPSWLKTIKNIQFSGNNCDHITQFHLISVNNIHSTHIFIKNNESYNSPLDSLLSKADIKFLTALQIYQSLYNTTDVPYLFVVPESSDSWPKALWSYSLGVKVNHIRYQGNKTKKDLVSALELMDFKWSARSASARKLIYALEIFKKRFGHTKVLAHYQIPSHSLYSLVFGEEGGSSDDPVSIRFEWPQELQTMRLGSKWRRYLSEIEGISSEAHDLVKKGLAVWLIDDTTDESTKVSPVGVDLTTSLDGMSPDGYTHTERVAVAVEYFKRHFGDLPIPEDYYIDTLGIPSSCTYDSTLLRGAVPWPKLLCDLQLGKLLRSSAIEQTPVLQNLNVPLSDAAPINAFEKFMLDLEALKLFKSLYRHINVPSFFVVPKSSNKWPSRMHGLKLGYNVRQIRKGLRHTTLEQMTQLQEVGLDLTRSSRQQNFEKTLLALDTHNRLFGDLLVPRYFIVPVGDRSWPQDTWGLKLGSRLNSIRAGTSCQSPEQQKRLREIGFTLE